jgi:nucleoside-diphosphate-sugar epimerase
MKKKIVIIGALGYLGTELCKIYSGESWKNKILALDSRFVSERVNQLNEWGIEFLQGQILDKKFLRTHLFDADIIHHLAGVTDVAYIKSESNSELDKKIISIGVNGTKNILNTIPKKCKIIFPSTHVVFEGLKKIKKNISENYKTKPVLTYAKSKVQNEIDIKNSKKNYIILRLGSVYGYSSDTMRINIMPNLFSKITSQNGTIKLFSGGKQLKSLVNVIDVARCMKFFEANDNIQNQIFHLVNEQTTVKKVANICKKINPKLKIEVTKNEIPNVGYTLSNEKLLKTGFKFLYKLEDSIREMINKWKFSENKKNLEYIYRGKNEYIDQRGKISNYELTEPINLIGYIESKRNTVRANHFHPIQEQKCLLIKGQFVSVYKNLLNENATRISHVVNEGDIIVTKPNVAHAMVFTKKSIFINLVRGEREHKNYGITHTIPHEIINKNDKKNILSYYKFDCRCCGNTNLKRVISLGFQPLANNLIKNEKQKINKYPLEVNYCKICHNVQLSIAIDSKKMFSKYYYLSSTSNSFKKHFENAAKKYIRELKLNKSCYIVDIGSNDGIGLNPFKKLGYKNLLGIEPAKNLADLLNKNKIKTFNGFFTKRNLKKIKPNADLILASNVFAHADNLKEMAECMISLLKTKGMIIIEVQYLLNTLKDLTFDNIYHEHFNYWSLTSLSNFFKQFDVKIVKAEKIQTHGGSIRIFIKKDKNAKVDKSVKNMIKEEKRFGIEDFRTYERFAKNVYKIKKNVVKNINKLKKDNKLIVGYGAPAKATTALNFFGIKNKINYIIEDNKLKHNKFIPGMNIPIYSKTKISKMKPTILVLAWNFFNEIKKNNSKLSDNFINIKSLQNK